MKKSKTSYQKNMPNLDDRRSVQFVKRLLEKTRHQSSTIVQLATMLIPTAVLVLCGQNAFVEPITSKRATRMKALYAIWHANHVSYSPVQQSRHQYSRQVLNPSQHSRQVLQDFYVTTMLHRTVYYKMFSTNL